MVDDLADLKKEIEAMQFAPRRRRASVNSIVWLSLSRIERESLNGIP